MSERTVKTEHYHSERARRNSSYYMGRLPWVDVATPGDTHQKHYEAACEKGNASIVLSFELIPICPSCVE